MSASALAPAGHAQNHPFVHGIKRLDGRQGLPGQDMSAALQSLAQQVSELQADNDRLREDYDQLSAEIARIRALMRQIGGAIAEQAGQLLAGAGARAAATTTVPGPPRPGLRLTRRPPGKDSRSM